MPTLSQKSAILRSNSPLDRGAFLGAISSWLSGQSDAEDAKYAQFLDLKNLDQLFTIVFSPEAVAHFDIPEDMVTIDVVAIILDLLEARIGDTMSQEIASKVSEVTQALAAEQENGSTAAEPAMTPAQVAALADQINDSIEIEGPDQAAVERWGRDGVEAALADAQAQIHLLREELERLANAAPQSPEPLVATSIPVAARAPDLLAPLTATTAVTDDAAPLTAPEPARLREIRTLLPGNATREERALETVMAEGLIGLEEPLYDLWNVDKCPEDLLPWLAWAFSVETWDHTWPAAFKRNTIRNSLALHRIKGTRRSVELALETLGMRATLREWFELIDSGEDPSARPHTFAVSLRVRDVFAAGYDVDARLRQVMSDLIENVKPVRTRFSLRASSEHHATVSVATRHNGRLRSRRTHCPRIAPHVRSVAFVTQTGWRAKLRDTRHATFEIAEAA